MHLVIKLVTDLLTEKYANCNAVEIVAKVVKQRTKSAKEAWTNLMEKSNSPHDVDPATPDKTRDSIGVLDLETADTNTFTGDAGHVKDSAPVVVDNAIINKQNVSPSEEEHVENA